METPIFAHFDGACAPKNPGGHMGIGCFVQDKGKRVFEYSGFVEKSKLNSCNLAEYLAFENVIDFFISEGYHLEERVHIFGDSKLVINQMIGYWSIHKGMYSEVAIRCKLKLPLFRIMPRMYWIPREKNTEADRLSNVELQKRGIKFKK